MKMNIEDKIKKQSEMLKKLKTKAKADAKIRAEKERAAAMKNIIAAGEIAMKWRTDGYKLSVSELRAEIEKLFVTGPAVEAKNDGEAA
ncbi:hypothetical protein [Trichlorobacter lovleyi]|uniref:hypothetical protein n=1 Tax=Trichlorobacter lovleyi TaxID=313985 RepID=UPI002FDE833E